MRRLAILFPIAVALALGLGMFLANLGYGIPGAKRPFLSSGTQRFSRSLSVGKDRPELVLAWNTGDFEFRSDLRLAEGDVLDFYFRVDSVRKGVMDFNRIRFEAGAELSNLGQDEIGERIQVPASLDLPLRLRGLGTTFSLTMGAAETTGLLEVSGESRFAHGSFKFSGNGRLDKVEIQNLGPPRNGMSELQWFIVPVLAVLLMLLFAARGWGFRLLVLINLVAFSVFVLEIGFRKSPILASAYDLERLGNDADTLEAFGFLHPERNLDVLTGRFTDLYSVFLPTSTEVYRVALVGFEAAGQEDRPPSVRWYAPLGMLLSERFGRRVEVVHAFHSGARPSACIQNLGPLLEKLGVDLVVWAVAPGDLQGFQAPAWEPAKEGWSPFLILNALGLSKGVRDLRFEGEVQSFARERKKLESKIKGLGSLADPGRAPWEVTGLEVRQRLEALAEEIVQALR